MVFEMGMRGAVRLHQSFDFFLVHDRGDWTRDQIVKELSYLSLVSHHIDNISIICIIKNRNAIIIRNCNYNLNT